MPRNIVITGISTGIGCVSALRLAVAGSNVFAGVRCEEDAADTRHRRSAASALRALAERVAP